MFYKRFGSTKIAQLKIIAKRKKKNTIYGYNSNNMLIAHQSRNYN